MLAGMRGSRVALWCAFAGVLVTAVVTARGETAIPGELGEVDLERGVGGAPGLGSSEVSGSRSVNDLTDELELLRTAVLIFVMVLFLVAIVLVIRHARRLRRLPRRLGTGVAEADDPGALDVIARERLRRAAEQARADLADRGGPPDDAVIAAWTRLEDAAGREGAGREPHQTPTEFTTALLGRHVTDEAALDELRLRYQRARFGPPGTVTAADVDAALAALDAILTGLDDRERTR